MVRERGRGEQRGGDQMGGGDRGGRGHPPVPAKNGRNTYALEMVTNNLLWKKAISAF